MKILNDWRIVILICLTLGLAPFFPEPHIYGKLKWLAGGAKGMSPLDYLDIFLYGFPFILLIRLIITKLRNKNAA